MHLYGRFEEKGYKFEAYVPDSDMEPVAFELRILDGEETKYALLIPLTYTPTFGVDVGDSQYLEAILDQILGSLPNARDFSAKDVLALDKLEADIGGKRVREQHERGLNSASQEGGQFKYRGSAGIRTKNGNPARKFSIYHVILLFAGPAMRVSHTGALAHCRQVFRTVNVVGHYVINIGTCSASWRRFQGVIIPRYPALTSGERLYPSGWAYSTAARLCLLQDGLVILPAVENTDDADGLGRLVHHERDHGVAAVVGDAQSRQQIITPRAPQGETGQALAERDDGIHIVGAGNGSSGVGDVPFNRIEAIDGLGRENDGKGHAAGPPRRVDRFRVRCSRTWSTESPRDGSACNAWAAGITWSRSHASTALSRAASVRSPSRMTSLSVAYSPAATLDRTRSAISLGRVMLNCCVERIRSPLMA